MSVKTFSILFMIATALPSFSQTPAAAYGASNDSGEQMTVPSPVSSEQPSLSFSSEAAKTSYVRGGLTFGSAYDDNVLLGTGSPVSDVSYTVQPTISLVESMSRLNLTLLYAPGFTFYQRTSSRNQANQNLAFDVKYRLSPHVTLNFKESFLRTSNYLNQFDQIPGIPGALQLPNVSVISPFADQMNTTSAAQISYQFAPNAMVGATGTFSRLTYLNRSQAPGLFDSSAKAAEGFYTHRLSGKHYIGATYQFQSLLTSPGEASTQTNSVVLFYTMYLNSHFTLSVFAGPQHSTTRGLTLVSSSTWSPEAGGSVNWQGSRTSFAVEVTKKISQGGGLQGAVQSQSASTSVRRQLTKTLSAFLSASYSSNTVLNGVLISGNNSNGHIISGNASLRRQLGEHLALEMNYTRLHQRYANLPGLSNDPDRNRFAASISYEFQRPLGR